MMAGNLLDLATRLELRAMRYELAASMLAEEVAREIVKDLANVTPVDTSKALSNWVTTIGAPSASNIDAYSVGDKGSTQSTSAAETIAQAENALQAKRPGQTIYITNNLPYIKRLNEGYSKQEPAGFVERAVLIGRIVIKNFKF